MINQYQCVQISHSLGGDGGDEGTNTFQQIQLLKPANQPRTAQYRVKTNFRVGEPFTSENFLPKDCICTECSPGVFPMSRKVKKQFPGTSSYLDRHGKRRWRYRKKGLSVELGTNYASKDFLRRYEDAVSDVERPKSERRVLKHSFYSLSEKYYQSSAYEKLAASTRKKYRRTLESFLAEYGEKSAATIKLRHVRKILNDLHNTPSVANQLRLLLQCLFELAMDYEWRNDNPADKTKPLAEKKENIHTWSEAEIAKFEARHPAGTLANTAMNLMLYTGAARVDVVKLGPQNVVEGRLRLSDVSTYGSN
ncbi:hypothetical protein [Shimia sp. MIT910701]|uniref:hypothetical protein n=1 Tax=Shimia sp. MIT910701 TaxID=3096987 RepID=UPI00399B24F5